MDLQKKLEEMGTAFEAFKTANDAKLKEVETKGHASAETIEKVEKANAAIGKLEEKIESMNAALARKTNGGEETPEAKEKKEATQYKGAMDAYLKKGTLPAAEMLAYAEKAMSSDSDEDGGFFISPEMSSEIVKQVYESSPIRELASVQVISSNSLEILQDLAEVGSGWVGEIAARADSTTPTLKKVSIPVHELYSKPKATQRFLDDSSVNVEQWLGAKVSEKFGRDEASAFMSGNGVNKPKGILGYAVGTTFGTIERPLAASATALAGDDFIDTQAALKEPYQGNANWLINRVNIGEIRKLKDVTSGQYIWQPGLTVGQPGSLLGRPVRMASDLTSTTTANEEVAVYGDFKQGYQIVDRIGIRVLRDPYSSKPYVEFYTTKRVGGAVKNFEALKVLKMAAS